MRLTHEHKTDCPKMFKKPDSAALIVNIKHVLTLLCTNARTHMHACMHNTFKVRKGFLLRLIEHNQRTKQELVKRIYSGRRQVKRKCVIRSMHYYLFIRRPGAAAYQLGNTSSRTITEVKQR